MRGQVADLMRFKHIRDAAEEIVQFVGTMSEDEFYRNNVIKYAIERCLIIIGEAASKISKESLDDTNYAEWKKTIGMRGKLVHDYNRVDYGTVYAVATKEMKPLIKEVNSIIDFLEEKFKDEL